MFSMKGSGIYSYNTKICIICTNCDFDDDVVVFVDDFGCIETNCPKCGVEIILERGYW